jgi:hypothetical protein
VQESDGGEASRGSQSRNGVKAQTRAVTPMQRDEELEIWLPTGAFVELLAGDPAGVLEGAVEVLG